MGVCVLGSHCAAEQTEAPHGGAPSCLVWSPEEEEGGPLGAPHLSARCLDFQSEGLGSYQPHLSDAEETDGSVQSEGAEHPAQQGPGSYGRPLQREGAHPAGAGRPARTFAGHRSYSCAPPARHRAGAPSAATSTPAHLKDRQETLGNPTELQSLKHHADQASPPEPCYCCKTYWTLRGRLSS